jgi:hypothetical protein
MNGRAEKFKAKFILKNAIQKAKLRNLKLAIVCDVVGSKDINGDIW